MPISPRLELGDRPIGGLTPREWLVVDQGVSREEVKEYFLQRGIGFSGSAILDLSGLCKLILDTQVEKERILAAPARQEVLRSLLAENLKSEDFPELRRLRRQKGFFRKLDRSIQKARLSYSSLDELGAQLERLALHRSKHPTRDELRKLISFYEEWLQEKKAWDPPRLLLGAAGALLSPEIELNLPPKVTLLSGQRPEGRMEFFLSTLKQKTEVELIVLSDLEPSRPDPSSIRWELWHTLDDAVEELADELHASAMKGELARHGVLIPDLPVVRRTLNRALRERGIQPEDPRDPTQLRFEEGIKQAFLPLDLMARDFERDLAIAFLLSPFCRLSVDEAKRLEQEIADQGILRGWGSYQSPRFDALRQEWSRIRDRFSARMTLEEMKDAHLELLGDAGELRLWVRDFFEAQWTQFAKDRLWIDRPNRKAPPRFWIERLRLRIEDATPPVERVKWRGGLQIYRLGQRPLNDPEKVWILGLSARYTTEEERGDYWLSARERDLLSGHFAFRSSFEIARQRQGELLMWLGNASSVRLLDAQYEPGGRERESLKALLKEIQLELEPEERGAHPRWVRSYSPPLAAPPRSFQLKPLKKTRLTASELENVSRCEFRGVVLSRWRLKEARDADLELRADARGTLLHEAVRLYLERPSVESLSTEGWEALVEEAWARKPPKGVFKSERLVADLKRKLIPILTRFAQEEEAYRSRSGARVIALDDTELSLKVGEVEIVGYPDRVDEVGDGLLLIDYKTSTGNPSGRVMIDQGYRLQMPIYALAAQAHYQKQVRALQFIELTRKGGRSKGIFPVSVVGEEQGKILPLTRRSHSLIDQEPDEIWSGLMDQIQSQLQRYLAGEVKVAPKEISKSDPYSECSNCPVSDVCGMRRFSHEEEGEDEDV